MCDYLSNLTQDKIDLLLEDSRKKDSEINEDDVALLSEKFKAVLNDRMNPEKHLDLQRAKIQLTNNTQYTRYRF